MAGKTITAKFTFTKVTKNTAVYDEVPEKKLVGGLYLQKAVLAEAGLKGEAGETITVTIAKA